MHAMVSIIPYLAPSSTTMQPPTSTDRQGLNPGARSASQQTAWSTTYVCRSCHDSRHSAEPHSLS